MFGLSLSLFGGNPSGGGVSSPPVFTTPLPDQTKTTGDSAVVIDLSLYVTVSLDPTLASLTRIDLTQDGTFASMVYSPGVYIDDSVPAGITADLPSLTVTITPATVGAYSNNLTVQVTNSAGSAQDTFALAVTMASAPVLTSPTDTLVTDTANFTASVSTTGTDGTLYWVVSTSATPPSAAQVKAGQNHTGAAATAAGSQSVSGSGAQNISSTASTLHSTNTGYVHFMHEDAGTNQSNVASADGFTVLYGPELVNASGWTPPASGTGTATGVNPTTFAMANVQNGHTILKTMTTTGHTYHSVFTVSALSKNASATTFSFRLRDQLTDISVVSQSDTLPKAISADTVIAGTGSIRLACVCNASDTVNATATLSIRELL